MVVSDYGALRSRVNVHVLLQCLRKISPCRRHDDYEKLWIHRADSFALDAAFRNRRAVDVLLVELCRVLAHDILHNVSPLRTNNFPS